MRTKYGIVNKSLSETSSFSISEAWLKRVEKQQRKKRNIMYNKVVNLVQVYNFLGCCVAISVSFVRKLKKKKKELILTKLVSLFVHIFFFVPAEKNV